MEGKKKKLFFPQKFFFFLRTESSNLVKTTRIKFVGGQALKEFQTCQMAKN